MVALFVIVTLLGTAADAAIEQMTSEVNAERQSSFFIETLLYELSGTLRC